jgi:hypothetical protein
MRAYDEPHGGGGGGGGGELERGGERGSDTGVKEMRQKWGI